MSRYAIVQVPEGAPDPVGFIEWVIIPDRRPVSRLPVQRTNHAAIAGVLNASDASRHGTEYL